MVLGVIILNWTPFGGLVRFGAWLIYEIRTEYVNLEHSFLER
jgi:hypothetical protein